MELALLQRIVLMVMTLSAANSQTEPHCADSRRAIHDLLRTELLDVYATLSVGQRVAMKSGSDLLLDGRVWQQVARDLLDRELVEGHIPVDRIYHPLTVTPSMRTDVIFFVAVAIGIARQVEPRPRRLLSEMRRC